MWVPGGPGDIRVQSKSVQGPDFDHLLEYSDAPASMARLVLHKLASIDHELLLAQTARVVGDPRLFFERAREAPRVPRR